MGQSVNKAILVGRLGRDPEVRYTGGGQAVANFTLATDESFKDKSGEKQKKTEWHNLVAWGKTAEFIGQYIHKGDLIYAEGRLQTRQWTDKEGTVKYTVEVVVSNLQGLVSNSNGDAKPTGKPAAAKNKATTRTSQQAPDDAGGFAPSDDDIDF
jgi:single-strand DNA-binding protein